MKKLGKLYIGIVLMFLYVPIFVLIVFSFNETKSRSVFSGFTFDWYEKLFRNEIIISSLINTIIIAVLASILSTILGTLAAIGINSMRKFPKAVVLNITNMPIINPEIVTGMSLMLLFVFLGQILHFENGFVTLLLSHIGFCTPYVILSVTPKLRQMDNHLFEAAQDLGANPLKVFNKVILPLSAPGIISGIVMVFMPTVSTFAIAELLTMNNIKLFGTTVQENIYNGMWNYGAALSLIMLLLIGIMSLFTNEEDSAQNESGGVI